jgi:hypothetical protein
MSTDNTILLATHDPLHDAAGWLSDVLRLELVDDPELKAEVRQLRGRGRTADGPLYVLVEPNMYREIEPEPEDVSAIDRYALAVEVRLFGAPDEAAQTREARAVFDELVATEPPTAVVLSHAMSWIVAAYLPGAGTHTFPPATSLDGDAVDLWRSWVV